MADFPVVLDAETLNGTNGFRILAPDGTGGIEVRHIGGSIPGGLVPPGFFPHPTDNLVITAFRFGTDFAGRPVEEVGAVQFIAGQNLFGQPASFPSVVGTFSTGGSSERSETLAEAEQPEISGIVAGIDKYDITGFAAASAGDVNGDGFADFMISAPRADPDGNEDMPVLPAAGVTYVVFGSADAAGAGTGFAGLDGGNGFRIDGVAAGDTSGWSVDGIGDFNGDGFDDMLIGANRAAPGGDYFAGASYVVFGSGDPFAASMDLADLDGASGFRIDGLDANDGAGYSVAGAGDVNGDGFADLIIGARGGDPSGRSNAGESYVLFGSDTPFDASFDVAALDGANGFRIDGAATGDRSGQSVASAGDVNGDGFGDLIVGAYNVDVDGDRGEGQSYQGAAYLVFGSGAPFDPSLDLATLDGADGFRLRGAVEDGTAQAGYSVASAGDVNGDGFDDLVIGALRADSGPGRYSAGAAFILFGSAAPFAADFDLTTLDGANGFRVNGTATQDYLGSSVSSAGDINGDGFDDLAISARGTDEAYIVFGRAPTTAVTRTGSAADQTIRGGDFDDVLNGLGGNDILDGGLGRDRLNGGAGSDTASFSFAASGIRLNLGATGNQNSGAGIDRFVSIENAIGSVFADLLRGKAGANRLDGGAGNDRLYGLSGRDMLVGGDGDDILHGGTEIDTMRGGAGDDMFLVHDAGDKAIEGAGAGRDQVNAYVDHALAAHVEDLRLFGTANVGTGNGLDNLIVGNGGANVLSGLGGNDTLRGQSGIDMLHGGDDADILYGALGNDSLFGDAGADRLNGEDGVDTLGGGAGNDRLFGEAGADILNGGTGDDALNGGIQRDTMTGGADADQFVFADGDTAATRNGADIITDFSQAQDDRINLRQIDADTATGGDQNFAFIGDAAFSGAAGELRYAHAQGNTYIEGDTNGDSFADFMIRLDGMHVVDAADFVV